MSLTSQSTSKTNRDAKDAADWVLNVTGAVTSLVTNVLENVERLVSDTVVDATSVAQESEAFYNATAEAASSVNAAIRATPRFWRVVQELLRLALAYRVHQVKAHFQTPEAAERALEELHQRHAARIYDLCIELRGGVLKVGQFVSSRMDLLPDAYVEALSKLQDRVPAIPVEQIAERIEQELGAPLDQLFETFEPEPLAAASLAQVHTAVLSAKDSDERTRVAVKVQVPEIEQTVEIDLAALKVMAGVLQDLLLPHLDLRIIAEELERSVSKELDYRREARIAVELAHNFEDNSRVVVPRIYESHSSDRILTMELIDGERLVPYLDACDDPAALFETLLRATCAQVLEHGLFQADPHPGNFLVISEPDGSPTVALLDFGAVTRFPDELQQAYAMLAASILGRDQQQVAVRLRDLGFRTRDGGDATLLRFAEMVMDVFRPDPTVSLADLDPREAFEEALTLAKANPVQVPQHFVLLGRVFAALGGLLLRYRPRLDLYLLLAPYLAPALARATRAA